MANLNDRASFNSIYQTYLKIDLETSQNVISLKTKNLKQICLRFFLYNLNKDF